MIPVERQALLEPVLAGGLHQPLVVLGQRHEEDDRRHVLEAVDPLAALGALRNDQIDNLIFPDKPTSPPEGRFQ